MELARLAISRAANEPHNEAHDEARTGRYGQRLGRALPDHALGVFVMFHAVFAKVIRCIANGTRRLVHILASRLGRLRERAAGVVAETAKRLFDLLASFAGLLLDEANQLI